MFPSLVLTALLAVAPAQPGNLNLTNVRNTYGQLGPTRASSKFIPGDVCFLAYDLEGVTIAEDGRAQYSTQLEVFDKDGKSLFKQEPAERIEFIPLGGGRIPAVAFVSIGVDQPPGEYTIKVNVTDKTSKSTKTLERKFEVAPPDFGVVTVYASTDDRGSTPAATTGLIGQTIFVNYSVVGFKRDAEKKMPNLAFELTPLDDAGKPTLVKPVSFSITEVDEKFPMHTNRLSLPLTRPGKFVVRISCTDKIAGKTATFELPVTVLPTEK